MRLVNGDTIPIVRIRCLRQSDGGPFDLTNVASAKMSYWHAGTPQAVRQKQLSLETPLTLGFVRFQQQGDDFPDIGINLYQVQLTDSGGGLVTGIGTSVFEIVAEK